METRTIRKTKFLLPDPDTEGLDPCEAPPAFGETLSEVIVADADWSSIHVEDSTITHSVLTGAHFNRAQFRNLRMTATTIRNTDLASSRWDNVKLQRCVFTGCSFIGSNITSLTTDNVVFEGCRFDYASIRSISAAGATGFLRCTMTETTFDDARLVEAIIADCTLSGTSFSRCDLRRADFRGSDIETVEGISDLRGAILEPAQLPQIASAMISNFELIIEELTER